MIPRPVERVLPFDDPAFPLRVAQDLKRHPKFSPHAPGGQCEDAWGILWSPSNREDWRNGGRGDLVPNLPHPPTGGVMFDFLRHVAGGVAVDESNEQIRVTVHALPLGLVDYSSRDDSGQPWFYVTGDSLGEACAKALLGVWGPA